MKLVFCGSREYYERFISKLWEKDKDVSNYRYVSDARVLHGIRGDEVAIKLASFDIHPEKEELWTIAQMKGITPIPLRDRPRIGHGRSASMAIIDEPTFGSDRPSPPEPLYARPEDVRWGGTVASAEGALTSEMITDTMLRVREQGFAAPTTGMYSVRSETGVTYHDEPEEAPAEEPWQTELRASSPNLEQVQQLAQVSQGLRPQEREEDRAARWWGDTVESPQSTEHRSELLGEWNRR